MFLCELLGKNLKQRFLYRISRHIKKFWVRSPGVQLCLLVQLITVEIEQVSSSQNANLQEVGNDDLDKRSQFCGTDIGKLEQDLDRFKTICFTNECYSL